MVKDDSPAELDGLTDIEPFQRADNFSSDLVTQFSVGYSDSRIFFVDFRAPDVRAFPIEQQGSPGGSMGGEPVSISQIQLPPKVMKELSVTLAQKVSEYEEEFGEIEIDRDTAPVYSTSGDSMLLARTAVETVTPESRVLDVGTGGGYVASQIAQRGATVVGTDINPHACQQARENGISAVRADLVAPFRDDTFDLVVFNPPYLPADSEEAGADWMDVAMYGGEDGRRVVNPFLDAVQRVLDPNGTVLMVVSSLTGIDSVRQRAHANGFLTSIVAEESDKIGKLVVLRLEPDDT